MTEFIFDYDIEAMKAFLNNETSIDGKLRIINRQLATTKRFIKLISRTKVAEYHGNGCWGIYTRDKMLSDLIDNLVESEKNIFNRKVTKNTLDVIIKGLKNNLIEYSIFLSSECKSFKREAKISKSQNEDSSHRDNRKSRLKAEDCIQNFLKNKNYDSALNNSELAPLIIKWGIENGYKKYTIKTIRPKISQYRNLSKKSF